LGKKLRVERIGLKIYDLRFEARDELYEYIDKYYKELPKNPNGTINPNAPGLVNNDIDALRHAFTSGVYVMEYSEETADFLGRLNELVSKERDTRIENMDLWNNSIGRKYGKKAKNRKELYDLLIKALKSNELIIDINDSRKFRGDKFIKLLINSLVITIKENKSGANIEYYDIKNRKVLSRDEFVSLIKKGIYPDYSVKLIHGKETPVSKPDRFKFNNLS
jgi:hypothetical protein